MERCARAGEGEGWLTNRRSGGAAEWHGRARGTCRARPPLCFPDAPKNLKGDVAPPCFDDCIAQPERAVRALVCDVLFGLGSENVAHIAADGSSPVVISSSATVDDIWRDV